MQGTPSCEACFLCLHSQRFFPPSATTSEFNVFCSSSLLFHLVLLLREGYKKEAHLVLIELERARRNSPRKTKG